MSYKIIIYKNPLSVHFRKKKISKYLSKFFSFSLRYLMMSPKHKLPFKKKKKKQLLLVSSDFLLEVSLIFKSFISINRKLCFSYLFSSLFHQICYQVLILSNAILTECYFVIGSIFHSYC